MTDLFVRELGTGPPVLFVHGGVFDGEGTWARQFPLADRFHLRIPDRRGHVQTPGEAVWHGCLGTDMPRDAAQYRSLPVTGATLLRRAGGPVAAAIRHTFGAVVPSDAAESSGGSMGSLTTLHRRVGAAVSLIATAILMTTVATTAESGAPMRSSCRSRRGIGK